MNTERMDDVNGDPQVNVSTAGHHDSRGLYGSVGAACDAWLAKRGMLSLTWKERCNEDMRRQRAHQVSTRGRARVVGFERKLDREEAEQEGQP